MQPWTTLAQDAGGSSPHSASARASVVSGSPRTTNAESTTRSRGASPLLWPSTSTGPSTAMPIPPMVALPHEAVNGPDTRLIPERQVSDTRRVQT